MGLDQSLLVLAPGLMLLSASCARIGPDAARDYSVLIGNSMIARSIAEDEVSENIGHRMLSMLSAGCTSAHKYSFLWIAAHRGHQKRPGSKPRYAVIQTRYNYITRPEYRVFNEPHGRRLAELLKAYPDLEKFVHKVADPDRVPEDPGPWDFNANVKRSFLPHMIKLAEDNGIQLIVLLVRTRNYAEAPDFARSRTVEALPLETYLRHRNVTWAAKAVVERYRMDMAAYLNCRGVPFIDYSDCGELTPAQYDNGDHVTPAKNPRPGRQVQRPYGKEIVTRLFSEDMKAIMAGQSAPYQVKVSGVSSGD